MITVLLGAAAVSLAASAWPFRRGASGPGSVDETDDGGDWIYGDGAARKAARDAPVQAQIDGAPNPEATQPQQSRETRRRAELDARSIVERAERQARDILAAAAEAPATPAPGRSAAGAARRVDEIIRDAEDRARQILAEASASGARVDAEATRVASTLMDERAKLAAFLRELLEEVEASVALGSEVLDLDEARERKQSTGATD